MLIISNQSTLGICANWLIFGIQFQEEHASKTKQIISLVFSAQTNEQIEVALTGYLDSDTKLNNFIILRLLNLTNQLHQDLNIR